MIDAEKAVERAENELTRLFSDWSGPDLRLEEVVTPLAAGRWKLTFSVSNKQQDGGNSLADLLRAGRRRKIVELAAEEGDLIAITAA